MTEGNIAFKRTPIRDPIIIMGSIIVDKLQSITTQSLVRCFFLKLRTNFEIEHTKIEKAVIPIAFLVVNPNNVMHIGVTIPPPPIPEIVARVIKKETTNNPIISLGQAGNKGLCSQFVYIHISKG